jgi:hypothetical protein
MPLDPQLLQLRLITLCPQQLWEPLLACRRWQSANRGPRFSRIVRSPFRSLVLSLRVAESAVAEQRVSRPLLLFKHPAFSCLHPIGWRCAGPNGHSLPWPDPPSTLPESTAYPMARDAPPSATQPRPSAPAATAINNEALRADSEDAGRNEVALPGARSHEHNGNATQAGSMLKRSPALSDDNNRSSSGAPGSGSLQQRNELVGHSGRSTNGEMRLTPVCVGTADSAALATNLCTPDVGFSLCVRPAAHRAV